MSRFAQYYSRFKHDAGAYDWEKRQLHLGTFFKEDDSIEFFLGEGEQRKVYKHRVYHLNCAPDIIVMRFANDIDIPVERDFEPAMAKDEPSCFVIIDNRENLRTVAIQKRMISYYVCNRKSYHRAQNMRWRWFRSNDNDEPLRYASRTLLVIRTMKGLRGRT